MPTTNSVFRPELGVLAYEYSLGAAQQGFIGRPVLPVFETDLRAAQYPMIPAEAILEMQDTARAPRAAYARGDYSFESAEYYCREYGWEEPLDDTEAMLYRRYFDAEVVAVQRATLMILRNEEKRVVEATINNAGLPNGAVAKAWSSYADADPLADINKAKDHFRFSVGLQPNALVLDMDILRHISMCDAVMDRIKYSNPNALRGELTIEQLKAYFGVANILVSNAVYNSGPKGGDLKVETLWPRNKVMLACLSSGGPDLREPCLGRTFVWSEDSGLLTTESYREEQTRGTIYRVRQNTDERLQFVGAGYVLTGVTE